MTVAVQTENAVHTAWEYRSVAAPQGCAFDALGQLLDKLGLDGWEYVDHFDGNADAPEAPPDLRGGDGNGRQFAPGVPLLDLAAAGAKRTIAVHYLIFKRPRQGRVRGDTE